MASAPPPPVLHVQIPIAVTCKGFKCSGCNMVLLNGTYARNHVRLDKCRGASIKEVVIGGIELPDDFERTRLRQSSSVSAPVMATVPAHASVTTTATAGSIIGDHNHNAPTTVNIQNLIVLAGGEGGVVKAGTSQESRLIQKIILENPQLRNMIRTIENAPGAIFRMTKGVDGPPHLRNVHRAGAHVHEQRPGGTVRHTAKQYVKHTAVELVDELQQALGCVTAADPPEVRSWADDVRAELAKAKYKSINYVQALRLYRDASTKFYKLPGRDAMVGGVEAIRSFIL